MHTKSILKTWASLNLFIVSATEEQCKELMRAERAGMNRLRFILRIHSRINRLRAIREREALKG